MIYDLSWVQRVNNSYICISIWALQRVVFKFWIFSAARSELGVVVVRLGLCDWQPIKAAAVETWSWVTPLKYLNICWCRQQQGQQHVLKKVSFWKSRSTALYMRRCCLTGSCWWWCLGLVWRGEWGPIISYESQFSLLQHTQLSRAQSEQFYCQALRKWSAHTTRDIPTLNNNNQSSTTLLILSFFLQANEPLFSSTTVEQSET